MTVTLLQFTNAVLKRVGEVAGDSEELATSTVTSTATGLVATEAFTDSRRQHKIDVVLQITNEAIQEVYQQGGFAAEMASATLVLAEDQREYDMPSDFERMGGMAKTARVMRGATTALLIREYPGGYEQMLADQPVASDYRGDPTFWAISPTQSKIRVDATPTSDQDGRTYNYLYHKRIDLSSTMATIALPFSQSVADSLVPVVSESYHRVFKKEFDSGFFISAINRSLLFLSKNERRDRYGIRRG